jgi:hypothetical protein
MIDLLSKALALLLNKSRLERLVKDKHSSLLGTLVNYGNIKLYNIGPRGQLLNNFNVLNLNCAK